MSGRLTQINADIFDIGKRMKIMWLSNSFE